MSIYDFNADLSTGTEVNFSTYKGKVLLIVNTATKCGFTPQLKDLQELYEAHHEEGLEILAFPSNQFMNQEPGTDEEIQETCQLNYGVTFPIFKKTEIKGKNAHPVFQYLKKEKKGLLSGEIKWNFTKFLVDKEGNVVKRYAPTTSPKNIESDIIALL